ncbi:MAG: cell division protein SepF [Acidimicrobiia bacterium]
MSSMWRKAMVHLGLGDDDEYDGYDPKPLNSGPAGPSAPRPEPQPSNIHQVNVTPVAPVPESRASGVTPLGSARTSHGGSVRFPQDSGPPSQPTVRPISAEEEGVRTIPAPTSTTSSASGVRTIPRPSAKPLVVSPRHFQDAQLVGDTFKSKQPVIINLQGVDRDLSRRFVDFTSGLCYGLSGQMEKVASDVFLLTPADVEVSREERQRLQEDGLYES